MPENNVSRTKTSEERDSRELEVDREIDSMFVPTMEKLRPVQKSGVVELNAGQKSSALDPAQNSGGFDLDALQAEIDKEIDLMFTPAAERLKPIPEANAGEMNAAGETGDDEMDLLFTSAIEQPKSISGTNAGEINAAGETGDDEMDLLFTSAIEQPKPISGTNAGEMNAAGETGADEMDLLFTSAIDRLNPVPGTGAGEMNAVREANAKDIDSLFTPAIELPNPISGPGAGETKAVRATGAGELSQNAGGFDLDSLYSEIDQEIDNLFVPLTKKANGDKQALEPPARPAGANKKADHTSSATGAAGSAQASTKAETAVESDASLLSELSDRVELKRTSRMDALPRLVECFNAAYLSLDWEFSRENIGNLQSILKELAFVEETFACTAPLFKILNVLLDRLYLRPHAANTRIVELIRDSQSLLAHILLMDEGPRAPEKVRVNAIIRRFRELREKSIAAKASPKETPAVERAEDEAPGISPDPEPTFSEAPDALDPDALDPVVPAPVIMEPPSPAPVPVQELRVWLDTTRRSISGSLEEIDAQIERLRQIEVTLAKTPALSPVTSRLTAIRDALTSQSTILRTSEAEWIDRAEWLDKLVAPGAERLGFDTPQEASTRKAEDNLAPSGRPSDYASTPGERETGVPVSAANQQIRDICLLFRAEEFFALPAENIVKIEKISAKTAARIFKRGHAALADFKPFFGGIKKGVLVDWAKFPTRQLKSYKFEPVGLELFGRAEEFPCMAVLASDGQRNRIIFVDRAELVLEASIDTGVSAADGLGMFSTVDGKRGALLAFDNHFD